jgi:hypothetical protein
LQNSGRVTFEPLGDTATHVTVEISYEPPAGLLGRIGEALGAGGLFEGRLRHDLEHFAAMVEEAPPGALDPTSSAYLFHAESAAAKGATTEAQDESMGMTGDADRATMTGTGASSGASDEVASTTSATTGLGGAEIAAGTGDAALSDPAIPRIPGTSANPADASGSSTCSAAASSRRAGEG